MSLKGWIAIGIALVLLLGGCFLYLREREARITAEAKSDAAEASISQLQSQMTARDKANADFQISIQQQIAAIKTPQAAAQVIDRYITLPASQPSQPSVIVPAAQLPAAIQQQLPDAPSYMVQTDTKAEATAKQLLQCQATGADLTTCQADKKDLGSQLIVMTNDRDQWKATASGGTWVQRALTAGKHGACGGAGAAVGIKAANGNALTGVISGGGTFAACELIVHLFGR